MGKSKAKKRAGTALILKGHTGGVNGVAVTPDGRRAVSGASDHTLRVWDLDAGACVATLEGHTRIVWGVAVTADGRRAVSGSADDTLRVWDLDAGACVATLEGHTSSVRGVAVTADGRRAVSGSWDHTVRVWDLDAGACVATLEGHTHSVWGVAVTPDGRRAVSGASDDTLRVWDLDAGACVATLEGHTELVGCVAVTPDGRRAVSGSDDCTVRVWDLTALRKASYTNAKVLFVGDTGVGKSGLAQYLTTGQRASQQISTDAAWATHWPLPHEPKADHGEREIWLWDFAGQPDYRLAHPLYMDDTALTVFVFNPQDRNPTAGLAEWDRMMTRASRRPFAKLLVAGRCDRGRLMVSREVIDRFREAHGFGPFFETSAETGEGCEELRRAIVEHIDWDAIPYTVSPDTFRTLKQVIVNIKDRTYPKAKGRTKTTPVPVLMSHDALKAKVLEKWAEGTTFTEEEFRAVVGLLHGPGVVWRLEFGDLVLLQPERVNAYAAALVRKVRTHLDEIGVIPEADVLAGDLDYADMVRLPRDEEEIVRRAMHAMLVERGLCIRDRAAKNGPLLIFPSLYKRERPKLPAYPQALMTFRFEGHLDEIYATLVVRLHHTEAFDKDQLYLDAADFVSRADERLVLKMTREEGRGEITVYADGVVSDMSRLMFTQYVFDHLRAKDPSCVRVRHYECPKCRRPFRDQSAVDEARAEGSHHVWCAKCRTKIVLDDVIERKFGGEEAARKAREMQAQAQAVLDNESKELILVGHSFVIAGEAGQIFRPTPNSDHGIDGEIEFKTPAGEASGFRLYLQLKSGDSYLTVRKDGRETFTIRKPRHVEYWREQKYPVMLVVRTSDRRIRWMDVREYLRCEHVAGREVRQIDFAGEPFTARALLALRAKYVSA